MFLKEIYLPEYLNIPTTPINDNTQTQVLVRNSSTGDVEYRTAASLTGSGGNGSISAADKEILYGTGTSTTSSPRFIYDATNI